MSRDAMDLIKPQRCRCHSLTHSLTFEEPRKRPFRACAVERVSQALNCAETSFRLQCHRVRTVRSACAWRAAYRVVSPQELPASPHGIMIAGAPLGASAVPSRFSVLHVI